MLILKGAAIKLENECKKRPDAPLAFSSPGRPAAAPWSEVVRDELRLMEQNDEMRAIQLQELRNRIDMGLAEAGRGEAMDGETFMRGLIEDLDAQEANRKAG